MRKFVQYILILGCLGLSSCNDWLDVKPRTEVAETNMFTTEEGFQDALTACYIKMNGTNLYGTSLTMQEVEWMAQNWSEATTSTSARSSYYKDFDYKSSDCESKFKLIYAELYNVIAQANSVLLNLEETGDVIADEQLRLVIKAEALAIRAFCHLDVLRLFGQMPVNPGKKVSLPYTETVSKETASYCSYEQFTDKILTDLSNAEQLLKVHDPLLHASNAEPERNYGYAEVHPTDYLSYRRFRFNYYAVQAIKARLYMYMGKGNEARQAALGVIEYSGLELAGRADFLKGYYSLPSECLLALSNSDMTVINRNLFTIRLASANLWMQEAMILNGLFQGQSSSINNRVTYLWNRTAIDGQANVRPLLRKYTQPEVSSDIRLESLCNQVIPLIRLSEMYLIMMETATSEADANMYYDTYMLARDVPPTSALSLSQIKEEVIREYHAEFIAEGQMFYTYKRMGADEMLWKTDRKLTEDDYIVPVPASELKSN